MQLKAKTWLVMRLTGFLLLAAMLQVSARGRAQTVTYSAQSAPLTKVLAAIEQQTGYHVFYDDADLLESRPVTVELKAVPVQQAMEMVLADQPLRFEILGNTISIARKLRMPESKMAAPPFADVHGRIVDEAGVPLAGISVKVKGTERGATTDADGKFELKHIDPHAVLVMSGVNIEDFEVKLKDKTDLGTLTARLKISSIQEIVVNKGYYSVKQRENTGDVTVVTAKTIGEQPVTDPMLALEGRVPGLYIAQASGIPGAYSTIRIRGQNSIANGTNPLFIIDGVPFPSISLTNWDVTGGAVGYPVNPVSQANTFSGGLSPFNNLNPADIESISVLKDADATAIYGARGANGVILITTKKGKPGQTRTDVNIYSGIGQIARRIIPFLNTQQYLAVRHEALRNDGILPSATDYDINGAWDTTRYTNWQKVLIGNPARLTNGTISLSGGTVNTQFLLSGTYSNQIPEFPGNFHDQKISILSNLNHTSVNQRFNSFFSVQYTIDDNNVPASDFTGSVSLAPDAPAIYDASGNLNFQNGTFGNPFALTERPYKSLTNTVVGSLHLGYNILPGLKIQSQFGYNHEQMNQTNQTPAASYYGPPVATRRTNYFASTYTTNWSIEPQIDYARTIGQGKFDMQAGASVQRNQYNSLGQSASNFSSDALISNLASAATVTALGNEVTDYRYTGLYGRVNYSWKSKYIVNLTARRDGSSRFGPDKRFGDFGDIGVAWVFSDESFMKNTLSWLSFGKLRGSYGITGNDQILDYQYLSAYSASGTFQNTSGLAPNRIANPNFAWEVNKKLEGGLELGFLNDHIHLDANYYRNRTGNQLVGQPLPAQDGFTSVQANLPAVVQNSGFDAILSTTNIKSTQFSWTSSFIISVPKNKLVSFPGLASNSSYSGTYVVGQPIIGAYKGYHFTGVDPQTGYYTYQDLNKDGLFTSADRTFMITGIQHYFGGVSNTFSYKGMELDVFFQYVNQTGRNFLYNFSEAGPSNFNVPAYYLQDYWRKPGDVAKIAKATETGGSQSASYGNLYVSDYAVSDASFLRLKTLALSYHLPKAWQQKAHFQNTRIYMQCQNLLTITSYKGYDPESQGKSLPPTRMITIGAEASF